MNINGLEIGSAGMGRIRTFWSLYLTLGIPFSRWGACPFICSPIPFPTDIIAQAAAKIKDETEVPQQRPHPFHLALLWRQQMKDDPKLNEARIAVREGISRARVTQIMELLELSAEIQKGLLFPPAPLKIHSFSERSLRVLVSCGDEEIQTSRWRDLVQERKTSACK